MSHALPALLLLACAVVVLLAFIILWQLHRMQALREQVRVLEQAREADQ